MRAGKIHYQSNSVKSKSRKAGTNKAGKSQKGESNSKGTSAKSRKLAFFMEKLKSVGLQSAEAINTENSGSGVSNVVKMIAVQIGMLLLLIVGVAAILVALIVAVIYNSPFSIFFPPLESGDTVMMVTSQYMAEFNREINTLVAEHKDCNVGKIVYVDYEGIAFEPSNYYDVMSVYMVKYGVGNTATIMNDTAKANLKTVFDGMCTYTTSIREEKIKNDEGKKEKKKVLYVNVSLKTYYQMETVNNVMYEYEKAKSEGKIGCQLVFSDIGTLGGKDFDVYNYVKLELIERGVPENEIAFIHDAKTDAHRDALFKEMRTGKKGF